MPKPILPPEVLQELLFPQNGVNLATEFELQPPGTTPTGTNVRAYEAQTQRARGGVRPGIAPYIPQQIPEGSQLIQHLNFIVDPSEAALTTGFEPLDSSVPPLAFGFPFGPGLFIPFTVPLPQGLPGGGIPDPSTNNLTQRIPAGRMVRTGGSGATQNAHVYSTPTQAKRLCLWFQLQTSSTFVIRQDMSLTTNWWNTALFGGVCIPKPSAPTLTWRIRVYHFEDGYTDAQPDLQYATGITELAHGDAGIALPDDLLTISYDTVSGGSGNFSLMDLTVLEIQGFPAGQYPTDLKHVLRSRFQCQYKADYNVP